MKKENQCLIILCGEAFSGKSTLAEKLSKRYEAATIGRDKIYFTLESALALEKTPDEDDEKLWKDLWPIAVQGAKNQLLLGRSVVFDDNCLHLHQREELYSLAKNLGIKYKLIYLEISAKTLRERKEQNKVTGDRHDVPSGWLEKDARKFERPNESENPLVNCENSSFDELVEKLEDTL